MLGWRPGDRARAALRAGFWSGAGIATSQALRLVSRLVLAIVIPPAAFGVWKILSSIQSGMQMLTDVGLGQGIVRNPHGDEPRFLDTAFTLQVLRGVLIMIVATLSAAPVARLMGAPQVAPMIPAVSLTVLLSGFASTAQWTLMRRMNLRPITVLNISAEVVGVTVALVWGWVTRDVWALIAGAVATSAALAVGSWIIADRRNRFAWDSQAARVLLHFGIGTFLSTATWFVATQGENFLMLEQLSSALGVDEALAVLGVLSMAMMLATTMGTAFSQVISQVLYPSISRAAHESEEAAVGQYRKARLITLGLTLMGVIPMALLGEWIVKLLFKPQFEAAGWMLRILAVRTAFEINQSLPSVLLMSAAKLKYAVIANCVRIAFLFVGVPLAFAAGGLKGAVWALSLLAIPTYIVFIGGLWRHYPTLVRGEVGAFLVLLACCVGCTWSLMR